MTIPYPNSKFKIKNSKFIRILILVVCAISFGSCENDIAEINQTFRQDRVEKEIVREVTMLYSDSGRVEVKIYAEELHRIADRSNPRDIFPKGVRVEFYDQQGEISSWLLADKATRYDREDKIVARENVWLYNVQRDTFRSEELIWDEQAEKVYTDRVFRFSSPDKVVYGYKFESNPQFTKYSFEKMSGRMQVESIEQELKGGDREQ